MRSAERVAAVFDLLGRSPRPLRHAEIAAAISLPKSSASNLLDTLTEVGLISRGEQGYSLGVKLIELGAAAAERLDLRGTAEPVMRELSELGVVTANLAILLGHDVLYVEKLNNPDHLIQIATRVGGSLPAHTTALGKVLVASLGPEERARWIAAHRFTPLTELTITSAAQFEGELEFVDAHGYALDEGESNLGTSCIAAAVGDYTGETVAAISLTSLSSDTGERDRRIAAVVAGARRVSSLLGARSTTLPVGAA